MSNRSRQHEFWNRKRLKKKSKKVDQSFGVKNSNFDPQTKLLDESTFKKSNSNLPENHSGSDWHGGKKPLGRWEYTLTPIGVEKNFLKKSTNEKFQKDSPFFNENEG